jgi:hypothetical protein
MVKEKEFAGATAQMDKPQDLFHCLWRFARCGLFMF